MDTTTSAKTELCSKDDLAHILGDITLQAPDNLISSGQAMDPELAGLRLFDAPLLGFACADDPLFERLKEPDALGSSFLLPSQWLPGAKTVISFFLPFTDEVKGSNAPDDKMPSLAWMHGRIDGQKFVLQLDSYLADILEAAGYKALCPASDPRFKAYYAKPDPEYPERGFSSNWSERRVAYIAGLGTFSLSKMLITRRGCAGRLGSVVTDAVFAPDERPYSELTEYCAMCGSCIPRCPMDAISLEHGKEHEPCYAMLNRMKKLYPGYYGCGKCACGVPCESQIPIKAIREKLKA